MDYDTLIEAFANAKLQVTGVNMKPETAVDNAFANVVERLGAPGLLWDDYTRTYDAKMLDRARKDAGGR